MGGSRMEMGGLLAGQVICYPQRESDVGLINGYRKSILR